jgi:hypothetical protein
MSMSRSVGLQPRQGGKRGGGKSYLSMLQLGQGVPAGRARQRTVWGRGIQATSRRRTPQNGVAHCAAVAASGTTAAATSAAATAASGGGRGVQVGHGASSITQLLHAEARGLGCRNGALVHC